MFCRRSPYRCCLCCIAFNMLKTYYITYLRLPKNMSYIIKDWAISHLDKGGGGGRGEKCGEFEKI